MYIRTKVVNGNRYVYLVEGRRDAGRVRQRVVCYIGPLTRAATGIPESVKGALSRSGIDWDDVNRQLALIPLTFDELSEVRRSNYARSLGARRTGRPAQGSRPRPEGELAALSAVAAARFRELFETAGEREYRMR